TLQPSPIGVTGDLYIGGIGLARGYWADEEKTNAGFIHHPLTGERLYRTGDLGRHFPDGTIEFLGRRDSQVKVNGHRIELGEIEAALEKHPSIRRAAVTSFGARAASKHLVAYFVPKLEELAAEAPASDDPVVIAWRRFVDVGVAQLADQPFP